MSIPEHFFEGELLPPDEAEARLLAECDSHEKQTYYRPLGEDEIADREKGMAKTDMKIEDLEEELKELKAEYTGQIKPLKSQKKQLLTEVRGRKAKEKGEVYNIVFADDKKVGTYDRAGRLLSTRDMSPEERQQNLRFDRGGGHMRAS